MRLTVEVKDGALAFSSPGVQFPVQCVGKDLFLASVKAQREVIRFVRGEKNEITRVAYHFRQFPKSMDK